MDSNHVTVVYPSIAQPGKLGELASIYADVTNATAQMQLRAEFAAHSAGFDREGVR
jgi:hypothetical protein